MTKSFLALKGTWDGHSIWANHPLFQQNYVVGQRVRCRDLLFPFFVCSMDATSSFNKRHYVACGANYDRVNVVQVFAQELSHVTPWVNEVNNHASGVSLDQLQNIEAFRKRYTIRYHNEQKRSVNHHFVAQRVKVLASYSPRVDAKKKLQFWSHKLHLPILTIDAYLKLHPGCVRS